VAFNALLGLSEGNTSMENDSLNQAKLVSTQDTDFILIRQKEFILDLIDKRRFVEAKTCIRLVKELWDKENYSYKTQELFTRIEHGITRKISKDD